MRISDLSRASGVPLPTLKFYLREGLLPAGTARASNQAEYGEAHLRRLRLIRALTRIGGLTLRQVREVLAAVDDATVPDHELLGVAQYALEPPSSRGRAVAREVDELLAEIGWDAHPDAPARATLGEAIATLRELGWTVDPKQLRRYANAVDGLAKKEVASIPDARSRSDMVERLVVGTVLYERILTALRRLAQEHHSARRFGPGGGRDWS